MSHILQSDNLAANLLLRQLHAANMLIARMIRTVHAAIDAVIGEIQRRKQHDALPVQLLFNLPRQMEHFFVQIRLITF